MFQTKNSIVPSKAYGILETIGNRNFKRKLEGFLVLERRPFRKKLMT